MADKSINDLPAVDSLADDGLLPVYQDGGAKRLTGALLPPKARPTLLPLVLKKRKLHPTSPRTSGVTTTGTFGIIRLGTTLIAA